MGTISKAIKKQFLMHINKKVVDISSMRIAKQEAQKNFKAMESMKNDFIESETDPLAATYLSMISLVSTCMYGLANTKELKDFDKIARKYQDLYMPSYPPMSPHTDSYYTMWEMLDLTFGPDKETLCEIFLDLAEILKISAEEISLIKTLSHSRMGIYLLCEKDEHKNRIKLRELVSNKEFWCLSTSGYNGKVGQLWYVRVLPPVSEFIEFIDYSVILMTPYILLSESILSWDNFFKNNGIENEESLHDFMKFGLSNDFWNEYIFYGFCNFIDQVVFLAGIPSQNKTLPCHDEFSNGIKLSESFDKMLLVEDRKKIHDRMNKTGLGLR